MQTQTIATASKKEHMKIKSSTYTAYVLRKRRKKNLGEMEKFTLQTANETSEQENVAQK